MTVNEHESILNSPKRRIEWTEIRGFGYARNVALVLQKGFPEMFVRGAA
jgi:hypothetical protein